MESCVFRSPRCRSVGSSGRPLISVLICTFNRARMLKEAISSVKAQEWPCEIIVVNDGSTDETERVLDAMDDVRVIHQENKGNALNAGLKCVRGEAVLVLDDDDPSSRCLERAWSCLVSRSVTRRCLWGFDLV